MPLISDTAYIYRSLSVALANPEKVFRLNLSKHKLKIFPQDIFKLKNLRELDLSKNKIDSIPDEIGTLTNLQRLNLSSNNIVQLPDEIGRLSNLTYLGLNRNEIEAIPNACVLNFFERTFLVTSFVVVFPFDPVTAMNGIFNCLR